MSLILTQTPFRVSLFGGGSDYSQHFNKHGGTVLSTTIDQYCYLTVKPLNPVFGVKQRIVWSHVENTQHWSEILHPSVKAALKDLRLLDEPLEIHYQGDLPARSGIGSSSAFMVGLLAALYWYHKTGSQTPRLLAREAIRLERKIMGEPGGIQDQIAVAHGGMNLIHFDARYEDGYNLEPIQLSAATRYDLERSLVMVYTQKTGDRMDVAQRVGDHLLENTDYLLEMQAMPEEAVERLRRGEVTTIGPLLARSWELKKRINPGATSPLIDSMYEKALEAGATGGKMMGTGGGGFMLLFAAPEKQVQVQKAICDPINWIPVRFAHYGVRVL